jgi:hypothetical protein
MFSLGFAGVIAPSNALGVLAFDRFVAVGNDGEHLAEVRGSLTR